MAVGVFASVDGVGGVTSFVGASDGTGEVIELSAGGVAGAADALPDTCASGGSNGWPD